MALEQVLDRTFAPDTTSGVLEEQVRQADLLKERVQFEEDLSDVGVRRELALVHGCAEVVADERKAGSDIRLDRVSKRPGLPVELGRGRVEEAASAEGSTGQVVEPTCGDRAQALEA